LGGVVLQAFGYLIVFSSILFLVFVTTKYVGGKAGKAMRGKNIHIVESVSLGMDKQIHLIKVGETFLLVATSGKTIQYLTTVNMENYEVDETTVNTNNFDFKIIFDKYLQQFVSKKGNRTGFKETKETINEQSEGDEFKSNLNRLRTITKRMDSRSKENGDGKTNEE